MTFRHLPPGLLDKVIDEAAAAGLVARWPQVTRGMSQGLARIVLPVGGSDIDRLTVAFYKLDRTRVLATGEVPLATVLSNAIQLLAGTPSEAVLRAALASFSPDALSAVPSTDLATLPRALGGGLETKILDADALDAAFLQQGAAATLSVARLLVHRHTDGRPRFEPGNKKSYGRGTGWLVAPTLVITNHHVVAARHPREAPASGSDFSLQGENTVIEFDLYSAESTGVMVASAGCLASDEGLDYAVLRVVGLPAPRRPLRLRRNPMQKRQLDPLSERVNVLQHPADAVMRVAFRSNFVVAADADRLSYLTETAGGSSGSPVCDDAWEVVALHRGWANLSGPPIKVWDRTVSQENFGTPIGRILEHLKNNHVAIHEEILTSQP